MDTNDPLVKFLLCTFAGYPLGFLYRRIIFGQSTLIQHLYFTLTGLALCYFSYGADSIHSIVNIAVIYLLLVVSHGTKFSVLFAFVFNTLYLLLGYYYSDGAALVWTTPHCVLCLRLIGVVMDMYDGKKKPEKLSSEQKETALIEVPSFLAMCGHVYFYGAFFAGPQFSMTRYLQFVKGEFNDPLHKGPPKSVGPALQKLCIGIVYYITTLIGMAYFNMNYMLTEEFYLNHHFITRCAFILISGKLLFSRYIGAWSVAEGVCVLHGLSYNGKDENGNILWDGVLNVRPYLLETDATLHGYPVCFNINTNLWMAKYVYKRLRFLGNKMISQFCTLVYLAIWHGLYSGYFVNFIFEFFMINSENQLVVFVKRYPKFYDKIHTDPVLKAVNWVIRKIICTMCVSYALVAFSLLEWDKYNTAYQSVYYVGHFITILVPLTMYLFAGISLSVARPREISNEQLKKVE